MGKKFAEKLNSPVVDFKFAGGLFGILAAVNESVEHSYWTNLGLIHHFRNDQNTAETMMRRALDIDTRIGNDFGVARDLGNLALIPEARGDLDTAERLNREALAIAERIGAEPIMATKLCNLGEIAIARGRRDEARALLVRAEALFRGLRIEKYRQLCARQIEDLDTSRAGCHRAVVGDNRCNAQGPI
jgi:Flp pilus assembly protein TadD